ncbi:hypothetical protein VHEMI09129 [[Torrubiella] hemipterigena]|uniref:Uncharacterized protein n=1 Tax=[Torrubiella] hemipterigena TaxID=1531966 RepID=A0A0A1TFJ0_9HYPO|nr:hypothetical protein VHEMI09129 [[Torrubiella] hemipterigena]
MPPPKKNFCVGSKTFNPTDIADTAQQQAIQKRLFQNDLLNASRALFNIPEDDTYVYHAMASVNLRQVQHVVSLGGANGLHAWYRSDDGSVIGPPSQPDIDAYVTIFKPQAAAEAALRNFTTNAKKGSIRASVAQHLSPRRYVHPDYTSQLTVSRSKKPVPYNPYFDFWEWACHSLEWVGPDESTQKLQTSHHVLPIFMHHFGCLAPSHEGLQIIKNIAGTRAVADVGSGNGYWTHMLRAYGLTVHPVDNMQSEWRVTWVDDTTVADGVKWLGKNGGGKDMVLLLVYPIVGTAEDGVDGSFTRDVIAAYKGDTIVVGGTQNSNGYTGFSSLTMAEYMAKEHVADWVRVAQVPLPSFPGKDEALYMFQRIKDSK